MTNTIKLILLLLVFHVSAQAQQRFWLDNKKSKILWKIESIGNHSGYILFKSGYLDYSIKGYPAWGYFVMDMNNIHSTDRPTGEGRAQIDSELKTPDFFDVAVHPTAAMNIKGIISTGNPSIFMVKGDLTIKGITKPINLTASITSNGNTVTVRAELKIDRTRWNIHHQPDPKTFDVFSVIKDKLMTEDIVITLNLVFNKG